MPRQLFTWRNSRRGSPPFGQRFPHCAAFQRDQLIQTTADFDSLGSFTTPLPHSAEIVHRHASHRSFIIGSAVVFPLLYCSQFETNIRTAERDKIEPHAETLCYAESQNMDACSKAAAATVYAIGEFHRKLQQINCSITELTMSPQNCIQLTWLTFNFES